jgi:hypothetical protein
MLLRSRHNSMSGVLSSIVSLKIRRYLTRPVFAVSGGRELVNIAIVDGIEKMGVQPNLTLKKNCVFLSSII